MHISHHQDFPLILGMGMPPTKHAITMAITQEGLAMGAEMTPILPVVNKVPRIPGSGNQDTLLLEQAARTLLGCILSLLPRRPISRILF